MQQLLLYCAFLGLIATEYSFVVLETGPRRGYLLLCCLQARDDVQMDDTQWCS